MPCFLFRAAGTAGALVDKTGFVRPVRPSVSGSRNLNDENMAASAAALGLAAGVCTGGVLNRTVLHVVTGCRNCFLLAFSAGAGIGFHGIRCAGNIGVFVFLYPAMHMRRSLNRNVL